MEQVMTNDDSQSFRIPYESEIRFEVFTYPLSLRKGYAEAWCEGKGIGVYIHFKIGILQCFSNGWYNWME